MHCSECHNEVTGMAKHIPLCVKDDKECNICPSKGLQNLEKKRQAIFEKTGETISVISAFGDSFNNKGIVEEYLITDKGRQTKYLGCSYPFKGMPKTAVVDSVANVKSTIIESLAFALKYKFLFIFLIPLYKKFLKDAVIWLTNIYSKDLEKKTYNRLEDFSPVTKELLRVGINQAKRNFPIGIHIH